MISMDLYREVFGDVETGARELLAALVESEATHQEDEPRWSEHCTAAEEAAAIASAAERGRPWEVAIRALLLGMSARGWATAARVIAGTGSLEGASKAGRGRQGWRKVDVPDAHLRTEIDALVATGETLTNARRRVSRKYAIPLSTLRRRTRG